MASPPPRCAARCTTQVLLCRCIHSEDPGPDVVRELAAGLAEIDVDLILVDDLCAAAAGRDLALAAAVDRGSALTVVACEARAVRCLLTAACVDVDETTLTVHNLRREHPAEILAAVTTGACCREAAEPKVVSHGAGWAAWFPVIDERRCTNCQQCASFCLFDVFAVTADGGVEVARPGNCKPNCPACARVCPEGAIIFPKSREAPVNGGDGVGGATWQVDLSTVLGDDPMAALLRRRDRARSRLLKTEAVARAVAERERCACAAGTAVSPLELPVVHAPQSCCGSQPGTAEDLD